MRRESVVREEVLNVRWTTLVVHVSVLDCRVLLGSGGLAEWSKVWFVMWGMVPVVSQAWCSHPITWSGLSMCMWPKAGYMWLCISILSFGWLGSCSECSCMMFWDIYVMDSVWNVSVNRKQCFCLNSDLCIGHLTDIYNKNQLHSQHPQLLPLAQLCSM